MRFGIQSWIFMFETSVDDVQSDVSTGWYVMKEENGETDIDYISMDGEKIEI
ncbi:MAG: hypothetical protein ACLU4N_14250 [Butyricimonas faecihominis]